MTEQQPVAGTQTTPEAPKPPESPAAPATEKSAADVEAEYKARLSGKDRAHAAEVATLQEQVKTAQAGQTAATSQATDASTDVTTLQKQLADSQNVNKQQAQDFALATRQQKYQHAAEALDPQTLATMDEAKLAGLNARLAPSAPSVPVDPNTPAASSTAPKPTSEKTPDELRADLKRFGPDFARQLEQ